MQKISNSQELQAELKTILAQTSEFQPSRAKLASSLRALVDRLVGFEKSAGYTDMTYGQFVGHLEDLFRKNPGKKIPGKDIIDYMLDTPEGKIMVKEAEQYPQRVFSTLLMKAGHDYNVPLGRVKRDYIWSDNAFAVRTAAEDTWEGVLSELDESVRGFNRRLVLLHREKEASPPAAYMTAYKKLVNGLDDSLTAIRELKRSL